MSRNAGDPKGDDLESAGRIWLAASHVRPKMARLLFRPQFHSAEETRG